MKNDYFQKLENALNVRKVRGYCIVSKTIIILFKILSIFIKKDKNLITILFRGYSGSNATPIIENLNSINTKGFRIKVLVEDEQRMGSIKNFTREDGLKLLKKKLKKYFYVFKSQLVISTHGFYRLRKDNIMLNLWHGIPLKTMSLMHKGKKDKVGFINDDYFVSTSNLYNTVINSCLGLQIDKYYIAGYPRNDYLFNQNGLNNLETILEMQIDKKVLLYMPTYREKSQNVKNIRTKNFFGFQDFNFEEFNQFLIKNNLLFILKLHPNEEHLFVEEYSKLINENIILLKSEKLKKYSMDLYKTLNAIDVLITDYSSVYFDYLLLDKPIIFTPCDLEYYRKYRGFLLEPYDTWTPGPKCFNQKELQYEIANNLTDADYFKKERKTIRDLFHEYQDGKSTERLIQLIFQIMDT